jgi:hypothetical protein
MVNALHGNTAASCQLLDNHEAAEACALAYISGSNI